jgi:MFS family permease
MAVAIIVLSAGYFVGGAAGDFFFKRTPRGRALTSMIAVLAGAILLAITLAVPMQNQTLFMVLLSLTALFIPIASPNVICTVYDITLPEVRSTAMAVQYFIESAGAALAPLIAGLIAVRYSLHDAILWICVSTWILCAVFFAIVAVLVPRDIATLRGQLRERAEHERALHAGQAAS